MELHQFCITLGQNFCKDECLVRASVDHVGWRTYVTVVVGDWWKSSEAGFLQHLGC